jgi:cytochrome b6-f complex iron-sulfur subunit
MTDQRFTRRSFLGRLLAGSLLVGVAGVISSVVAYLFPAGTVMSALGPRRVRVGKAADIPIGQGKLTLVNDEPVWIVHLARGFVGRSALCTHQGCIVKWQADRRLFTCPCHHGLFDERGNVIAGFPLRPLPHVRVGVVQGDVYVSSSEEPIG